MHKTEKGWAIEAATKGGDLAVLVGNARGSRLFVRKLLHDIDLYELQNLKAELAKAKGDAMKGHSMAAESKKQLADAYGGNPHVQSSLDHQLRLHLKFFNAIVAVYVLGAMPILLASSNATSALSAWSFSAAGVAALPLIAEAIRGAHMAKIWRAFRKAGMEADFLLPSPGAYLGAGQDKGGS